MVAFDKGPKDNELLAKLLNSDIVVSHQTETTDGTEGSQVHTHWFACGQDQAVKARRTIPVEFEKPDSYMKAAGFTLADVREVCDKIKDAAHLKEKGQTPPLPNLQNARFNRE